VAKDRRTSRVRIRLPWLRRNFNRRGIRAAIHHAIVEKRSAALQPVRHRSNVHLRHQIARQIRHEVGQAEGRDRVAAVASGQRGVRKFNGSSSGNRAMNSSLYNAARRASPKMAIHSI